jgi:hypothetical protein
MKSFATDYTKPKIYEKPHKFFEKYINNDLDQLSRYLLKQYSNIETGKLPGVTDSKNYEWAESGSVSTTKWKEYNVFQFNNEEIHNVFAAVKDMVSEACECYEIDFKEQRYMVQGWFNINYNHIGKLGWHEHGGPWAPYFHGYYSIKSEPSITYYKINNDENNIKENFNVNNRLILSEMGHPHAMGDWDWEGPRITLAYDIVPLRFLIKTGGAEQHWIPLV